MATNQEIANVEDDPTCAQLGCVLSTCCPCVGCFTYCVNRSAGQNSRRWAFRALLVPIAFLAIAFVIGTYLEDHPPTVFYPPVPPPPSNATTPSPYAQVDLVDVQSLQPWFLVPMSSALFVVVQFILLGYDIKTAPGDGRFTRCCKRCGMDSLFKVGTSLVFIAMALSTMRNDFRQVWNVVGAGADWRTVVATVVAVGVTSSNFKASMAIYGSVRVQTPSSLFGKSPHYPTCPAFCAGLPLSPWASPWLPWHKWVYFVLLQVYRVPLLLAHVCLLAVFFVLWGFPWCCICFHTHLHGCLPNCFRSGWMMYLLFILLTIVFCWIVTYFTSMTFGFALFLFLQPGKNNMLTALLAAVGQVWEIMVPGFNFLALSLWCHCFPLLVSLLLSRFFGAQEIFKAESCRRPEVILSKSLWSLGKRLLRHCGIHDGAPEQLSVEEGSLGRPRSWLPRLCCFCLSPMQFFLPVFLSLFEQRRPYEVYSSEHWDELWSFQTVAAQQPDTETEMVAGTRSFAATLENGRFHPSDTSELPGALAASCSRLRGCCVQCCSRLRGCCMQGCSRLRDCCVRCCREPTEFESFVSQVKFLVICRTLFEQSSMVIHQMSLLILARWFAGTIENAAPVTDQGAKAGDLYFIHACRTTLGERQMASYMGYLLGKAHKLSDFLQVDVGQYLLYFIEEILPMVSNVL